MNLVITGDIKSSRKMNNRSECQENLKIALNRINNDFRNDVLVNFRIVGGDGFQGMISNPNIIIDIYLILFELLNHPFYMGVGIGEISTDLSLDIQEIDGSAFHSSQALGLAKKNKRWIIIRGNLENSSLIECIFNLIFEFLWKLTSRQKEVMLFYRKCSQSPGAIENTSSYFKSGNRNIYKILESAKYNLLEYAEETLKKEFNKNSEL